MNEIKTNEQKNKNFKLLNNQNIIMNNNNESKILNNELIIKYLYSSDDGINTQIYNQIYNPYQKKLNTINLILKSNIIIPFKNSKDIIKFFNWLSPLNNEFNFSSKDWNIKTIKYGNNEKFLLQNSISKKDIIKYLYKNYIDLIKKKLNDSNIKFLYFEFKSKRFNKIKDIIWVFDI
jgi:hypothetical protein